MVRNVGGPENAPLVTEPMFPVIEEIVRHKRQYPVPPLGRKPLANPEKAEAPGNYDRGKSEPQNTN